MPSTILSDNGVTSGTAGIKTTGSNDGALALQTTTAGGAATTALEINTSQQVSFTAGTAAAPAITPTGDTNTGIFFPAADTIAFAEGGAEAMRIDASGRLLVGTNSSFDQNAQLQVAGTGYFVFNGFQFSNDQYATTLSLKKSRGTTVGTNTIVQNGDTIGTISFFGANGTGYNIAAAINVEIDGTPGASNDMPGRLIFGTTADGAGSTTERARITSGGYFKASDTGSYISSAANYHEFVQSANLRDVFIRATNASYADSVVQLDATRSASTAYNLLSCSSGADTDTEFRFRGDGNAYADGTFNNNGADYAEFFESANGQALTLGATVVLDGTKVREATAQDDPKNIIGVVRPKEPSKASMVVGNTAWNKWANKYLTDDFDRYIMEDHDVVEWEEQVLEREAVAAVEAVLDEEGNEVSAAIPAQEAVYKTVKHSYESHNIPAGITVPADAVRKTHDDKGNKFQHYKLNPAWDKDAEYTPREKRPEWNIIGLLGQVKILKGQPVSDRWIKMRDVSATVEEWMIR